MGRAAPAPIYAPPPPPPTSNNGGFRDSDFGWSTASGTGQIVGVLAYKGAAAHSPAPAAPGAPPPPRPRAETNNCAKSPRRAECNAAGHFSFSGLPDGAWYVI